MLYRKLSFYTWSLISCVFINCCSCKKNSSHDSANIDSTNSFYEANSDNTSQDVVDLYSCFGMDSLKREKKHFYLVAGQELKTMNMFLIQPDVSSEKYLINVFEFRLAEMQDTVVFNDTCRINQIIYDRIEFRNIKNVKISKKEFPILSKIEKIKPGNPLGKFDTFFFKLCEMSYQKETLCVTVYKGEESLIESFFYKIKSL